MNSIQQLSSIDFSQLSPMNKLRQPKIQLAKLSLTDIKTSKNNTNRKNFYHHTSIYKLKEYKDLTSHHFYLKNEQQYIDNFPKKVERKKLLVADFKRKVAEYLITSKFKKEEAIKSFRKFYRDMKAQITQTDITPSNSFNNTNQRLILDYPQPNLKHQINKNVFNYRTLRKIKFIINNLAADIPGLEIKVLDSSGKIRHEKLDHRKLQEKLLIRMEPFLNNEKIDYDAKLMGVLIEYERIVDQIYEKGFHVRLPENFYANPQNFNDFYEYAMPQKSQSDDYLEMLISYTTTPVREPSPIFTPAQSKTPELEQIQEPLEKVEDEKEQEVEIQYQEAEEVPHQQDQHQEIEQPEDKPPKQQEKKMRQSRKKTQKPQQRELIILNPDDDKPMLVKKDLNISMNQNQTNEEMSEEQKIQQKQKEREMQMQIEIQKAREERRREIERLENELRQKKGNTQQFVYVKEGDNSEQKFLEEQSKKKKPDQIDSEQSEKTSRALPSKRNITKKQQFEEGSTHPPSPQQMKLSIQQSNQSFQQPIQSQRKLKATKKEIIKQSQTDISQPEEPDNQTNSTIQQDFNQQMNQSSSTIKPNDISNQASFRGEQPNTKSTEVKKKQTARDLQNITKGVNIKQQEQQQQPPNQKIKTSRILTDETQNNQSIKQDQSLIKQESVSKQDQSSLKQDQSSVKQDQSSIKPDQSLFENQSEQQKTLKTNESMQNTEILEERKQTEQQQEEEVLDELHEKIHKLQTNIDEQYKRWYADVLLASDNVYEVDINEWKISQYDRTKIVMPNIELGEDRVAFYEMFCWKEEIQQVIPRLRELNLEQLPDEIHSDDDKSPIQKKKDKKKKNNEQSS